MSSMPSAETSIRDALRAELKAAMKRRDKNAMSACRVTLAAIDNAEAQPVTDAPAAGAIEASAVGVGAAEAARRELSEAEVRAVVAAEIEQYRSGAQAYDGVDAERRDVLLAQAAVLEGLLPVD